MHSGAMSRAPPSNCLFLPELPIDLTDATLERHFRGFVGFQVARTRKDRNGKLVGFVEFDAVDDAVRARDSMQGTSPFEGINWHIHYSNNTKGTPKRPREEMEQPVGRMEAQRPAFGGMCAARPAVGSFLATHAPFRTHAQHTHPQHKCAPAPAPANAPANASAPAPAPAPAPD